MLVQHFQRAQLVGHLDRQTALLAGDGKGDLGQLVQSASISHNGIPPFPEWV